MYVLTYGASHGKKANFGIDRIAALSGTGLRPYATHRDFFRMAIALLFKPPVLHCITRMEERLKPQLGSVYVSAVNSLVVNKRRLYEE